MMQYVSLGAFRAHLLTGANCISIKQTHLYQRRLTLERKIRSELSLVVNWLSVVFEDGNFFVLVVTGLCSALPVHLCSLLTW